MFILFFSYSDESHRYVSASNAKRAAKAHVAETGEPITIARECVEMTVRYLVDVKLTDGQVTVCRVRYED